MDVCFEDEHIIVATKLIESDTLVVTFAHMDFYKGLPDYWGSAALQQLPVAALGIICKKNTWFPYRATHTAIDKTAAVWRRYSRRLAYGFSMGGYGALKYGGRLEVAASLSLSPQVSIDPTFWAGRDMRFSSNFCEHLNAGMTLEPCDLPEKAYVLYDPIEKLDRLNFEVIEQIASGEAASVVGVECHHVGHDTPVPIASTATLSTLIPEVIERNDTAVIAIIKQARRRAIRRAVGLALASVATRPKVGDAIMQKYGPSIMPYWVRRYERARDV